MTERVSNPLNMASLNLNTCGILLIAFTIPNIRGEIKPFPVPEINPDKDLFVAFGPNLKGNSDRTAGVNDDGSTGLFRISKHFPFFDGLYKHLSVSTNGVIGPQQVEEYAPDPFPLHNDKLMIAPFWADIDLTENGGRIYYRFVCLLCYT